METNNSPAWKKALTDSYPKFQALNPERAKAELGFATKYAIILYNTKSSAHM